MYPPLTPRQTEIVELLCRGLTAQATAARLGISTRTVEVHQRDIHRLWKIHNRAQLVRAAIHQGVVSP